MGWLFYPSARIQKMLVLHCSISVFSSFERKARKKGSFPTSPTSPRREASLLDLPGYFIARPFLYLAVFFLGMAYQQESRDQIPLIPAACRVNRGKPVSARSNLVLLPPQMPFAKGKPADLAAPQNKALG